jgi:hypothetical protein
LLTWTERILSFPVRTAAISEFLRELSARGWGDLNGVLTTLNDTDLCREAVEYWLERGWIVRAPSSALSALVGPNFSRELTMREFCGEEREEDEEIEEETGEAGSVNPAPSPEKEEP